MDYKNKDTRSQIIYRLKGAFCFEAVAIKNYY